MAEKPNSLIQEIQAKAPDSMPNSVKFWELRNEGLSLCPSELSSQAKTMFHRTVQRENWARANHEGIYVKQEK